MSSPLSSLKKTKRTVPMTPPSHKNVPYRYEENSLLDEVTSRMANRRHPPTPRSQQGFVSDTVTGAPSDTDLMQSMISRIAILEKHAQLQAKQIQDKDKRIMVLEDKCRLYQKMNTEESSPRYTRDLETKCLRLQQQLSEMEEFLLDYGMMWVGQRDDDGELDSDDDSGSAMTQTPGGVWDPNKSVTGSQNPNPYNIDFDTLIENINELNQIAGDGETKIEKTKLGARFKMPDPVQLILYSNGIVMFEGPFRSYDEQATQTCMTDFMDGFFPAELQSRYPDGVPFKVIDKRDVRFDQKKVVVFTGQGQSVGGDTQPSRLIPSVVNKPSTEKSSQHTESTLPGTKLSADQFLSNLPSSVVRSGRVIDIRNSLSEAIKGSPSEPKACPVTIVQTETMQEIKDRLDIDESVRPPSGKNITTLRIKDTDNHTYVLKMKFSDTIQDILNYLNELRGSAGKKYNLVTTFPSKVYKDMEENLFSAGLTPNATMHIRPLKE